MKRSRSSQKKNSIPVVLTIAGSDCSGGAGLQADLKTFTTLGVYGTSAVTCVVAENPGRVARIDAMSPASVRSQIELTLEAFPVAAIKTGMLYSRQIILTVADVLKRKAPKIPLVIDPVMMASAGGRLLKPDALHALRTKLIPLATLVTPNIDEAIHLLDGHQPRSVNDEYWLQRAASMLYEKYQVSFLVKGGHFKSREAVDILCRGETRRIYRASRVKGVSLHGTGCTFSAAITAHLAKGLPLESAVAEAKKFITQAIRDHHPMGVYGMLNQLSA
jgi:hydroxymethylpyrimidine/phosphomethylpyrimidine kinase